MGLLLDTETLIVWSAAPQALDRRRDQHPDEELHVSVITADELLRAAEAAPDEARRVRRRAFVESVLELFPLLPLDRATVRAHAALSAAYGRRAGGLSPSDRWLAATCLAHGLTLMTTRPEVFAGVAGLACEAWPGAGVELSDAGARKVSAR